MDIIGTQNQVCDTTKTRISGKEDLTCVNLNQEVVTIFLESFKVSCDQRWLCGGSHQHKPMAHGCLTSGCVLGNFIMSIERTWLTGIGCKPG